MSEKLPNSDGAEPSGAKSDGLRLLITDLISGELAPREAERLTRLLAKDSTARAEYQRQIVMHAMLHWRYGGAGMSDQSEINPRTILELMEEVEEAAERRSRQQALAQVRQGTDRALQQRKSASLGRNSHRRARAIIIPRSVAYVLAGSIVALFALVIYGLWPQPLPTTVATVEGVATVEDSVEAEWRDSELSSSPGTRLSRGRYELVGGILELSMDDGAMVMVESPAIMELVAAGRMRLHRGKLVGKVPRSAIGFVVETPLATLVDLGTEFGVAVDEHDASNVQVFDGRVEAVIRGDDQRVPLVRDQAVRMALVDGRTQVSVVPLEQMQFVRRLPNREKVPPYAAAVLKAKPLIYWRFEAAERGTVKNEMGGRFQGRIQTSGVGATGLRDGVMVFEPSNPGLVVCENPRDLPILRDYSVELWMKPARQHRGALVSMGVQTTDVKHPTNSGILVAVCGPTGRPRDLEDPKNRPGYIRFLHRSPPTEDGRFGTSCYSGERYTAATWQHVVAVKDGPEMRLYVNGQLSGQATDASVFSSSFCFHVGQLYARSPVERPFVGELDELAVYDRVLRADEVIEHFELPRPSLHRGDTSR